MFLFKDDNFLQEADESWDPIRQEFFFDRNPRAFEVILHLYRSEELHIDQSLCGNVIKAVSTIHKICTIGLWDTRVPRAHLVVDYFTFYFNYNV